MDESSSDEEDDSVVSPTPPEPPYSVAASMTPVKSATPVDNDHTSNKYPHISRALGDEDGYFDPADPSVIKSMQGLLQEINNLLSTVYELNLRAITSNRPISYVRVPRTKSDNESMAGHQCMQCKVSRQQFTASCELWNMKELMRCGEDAERKKGDPLLGAKKNMMALHTFVQLHDSSPPLRNQDR